MTTLNPLIDDYLKLGCGRCELHGTPQCKVHSWQAELKLLRELVLSCGLTEELKWNVPCYTHSGHNILIVAAFKEYASVSFFKGALLPDAKGILDKPGANSQAARVLRFTSVQAVHQLASDLKELIGEAIKLEQTGSKIDFKAKHELVIPAELERKFEALPALRSAFAALTPGRQRGYVIYFEGAKQSKTRESRIDKCIPQIMEGRGMHD